MNFDTILDEIGSTGKAQLYFAFLCFIHKGVLSFSTFMQIFIQGDASFRCFVPECDGDLTSNYEQDWTPKAFPLKFDPKSQKNITDQCKMYTVGSSILNNTCSSEDFGNSSILTCNKYIFQSQDENLIKEWNLTCDKQFLLTLSMSIFMSGFLVGVYTFGLISDRFGRRTTIIIATAINIICSTANIFSVNFYMYLVLRFFIAASGIGVMTTSYVLLSEVIGVQYRYIIGMASSGWQLFEFYLIGIAYSFNKWRYVQAVGTGTSLLFLIVFWVGIESPKWLISQGRYEEAKIAIQKFAKLQGKKVPEHLLEVNSTDVKIKEEKKKTFFDLFKTAKIRKRMILISMIWFADSLISYGISLGARNMPGNIYVNFACLATGDLVGVILLTFLLKYSKRMLTICFGMLLVGVILFCSLAVSPDSSYIIAAISMIGKFLMTVSFNMTYVYTAELFPTALRSTALGTGSMFSRVGGILAPVVASLINVWRPFPILIMGTCGFIGAIVITFLPETLNKPLPMTIEELENSKDKSPLKKIHSLFSSHKNKSENSCELKNIQKF